MDATMTPGPWRRMVNTAGGFGLWSVETDSANVARVENGADADLIAAAPDLLAACADAADALRRGLHNGTWVDVDSVRARLSAAVTKATGGGA